ncbi:MAG: hypothetical protein AAFV53_16435 [Myxococcota bacterium]
MNRSLWNSEGFMPSRVSLSIGVLSPLVEGEEVFGHLRTVGIEDHDHGLCVARLDASMVNSWQQSALQGSVGTAKDESPPASVMAGSLFEDIGQQLGQGEPLPQGLTANGSCVEMDARLFHPLYMQPAQKAQYAAADHAFFAEDGTAADAAQCSAGLHKASTHLDTQLRNRLDRVVKKLGFWSQTLEGELLRQDEDLVENHGLFSTLMVYGGVSAAQLLGASVAPAASMFLHSEAATGLASLTSDMLKYLIKSKTKESAQKFASPSGVGAGVIARWRKELMVSIVDAFSVVGDIVTISDNTEFKEHFHRALGEINRNNDLLEGAFRQSLLLDFIHLADAVKGQSRGGSDNLYHFKVSARMTSAADADHPPAVDFVGVKLPASLTDHMFAEVASAFDIVNRNRHQWEFAVELDSVPAIFSCDSGGRLVLHDLPHHTGRILGQIGMNRVGISDRYQDDTDLVYRAQELRDPEAVREYEMLQKTGARWFYEAFEAFMGTQSLRQSGVMLS